MENLVDHFRKSFEEAYDRGRDHGFEHCFLQMKIYLGKYLLHEGKYKSADSLLEYVLSLKLTDITDYEETKSSPAVYNPKLDNKPWPQSLDVEIPQVQNDILPPKKKLGC